MHDRKRTYLTQRHTRNRRGFTLLEVLVVVACIVMLVAILLPTLRRTREQARRAACQSNLKQIALAWHMYLDTNKGHFLQGVNTNWNYGGKQGATFSFKKLKPLNPLLHLKPVTHKDAYVFRCPADNGDENKQPTYYDYYGTSYQTNLMLVGQNKLRILRDDPCKEVVKAINEQLKNLRRDRIGNEAGLVLMGDGGWWNTLAFYGTKTIEWHNRRQSHNLAFMDGHVEFLTVRKGLNVTPTYNVIPFENLRSEACDCQEEVPAT